MSGGVDSSVAAALLLEQGHEVVGCFMRLGSDGDDERPEAPACEPAGRARHQGCCSLDDAADARMVAALLDIPFYVLNFKDDFGRIMDYFVREYNRGRTPNPCIRCNNWLKFGKLAAYARSIDADHFATGHYARVEHGPARSRLLRARDGRKDQSYVLFGTRRESLRRLLLPNGDLEKSDVRGIARRLDLPVFDKPDSQEICFVPDNDYFGFIRRHSPRTVSPGKVVDWAGRVVGEHSGHQQFTIGQRRGLNVSLGYPIYVTGKDPRLNTVTIGLPKHVLAHGLAAEEANWLIDPPVDGPVRCEAKIRSNSPAAPATVRALDADRLVVRFDACERAISPGQAVVCYQGDELIGGGWISEVDEGEGT